MTAERDMYPEIPTGPFCGHCQYHSILPELPKQYNGYCSFLGKSDLDLAKEIELEDMETGETFMGDEAHFPVSLLWDGCKMCGINDEWDEDT